MEDLELNSEVRERKGEGSAKLEEEKNTCWAFHACGKINIAEEKSSKTRALAHREGAYKMREKA